MKQQFPSRGGCIIVMYIAEKSVLYDIIVYVSYIFIYSVDIPLSGNRYKCPRCKNRFRSPQSLWNNKQRWRENALPKFISPSIGEKREKTRQLVMVLTTQRELSNWLVGKHLRIFKRLFAKLLMMSNNRPYNSTPLLYFH